MKIAEKLKIDPFKVLLFLDLCMNQIKEDMLALTQEPRCATQQH